jgi:hypothetical protein
MSVTRVMLLVAAAVLFSDFEYGNARLWQFTSGELTRLGGTLSHEFDAIVRRIAPR